MNIESLMNNLTNDTFFFTDQVLDGTTYRIFNYRLSKYSDFLLPNALEMRGTMFRKENNETWSLVCRPMEKFFNLEENPFTMNLNLSEIEFFQLKEDGSLISSFIHNGELRFKSKGSIKSIHAIKAMNWINLEENKEFKNTILDLTSNNFTVNLEWCSPEERIVVNYPNAHLKILNIRNLDGHYLDLRSVNSEIKKYLAEVTEKENPEIFAKSIKDIANIEGYVAYLKSGLKVKIKTSWYYHLHHTRGNINNPKKLFAACINEGSDDLRSLFSNEENILKEIENMEILASREYNKLSRISQEYFETNKDLSQKDYAIKAQKEYSRIYFTPIMALRSNKAKFDLKEFMIKNYKEFGIEDVNRNLVSEE